MLKFGTLHFEESNEHINKMPFSGICLRADTPSDGIPCGSDKPIAFSATSIINALDTFKNMGVNCVYDEWGYPNEALTGHDTRFKIGVVEKAEFIDNAVNITGSLWKSDFNDVCFQIKNAKDSLGFSIEVVVNDMTDEGDCYLVNDFMFTGVAILYKNLAAFKSTQLQAKRQKENEKKEGNSFMNEEQFKQFMEKLEGIGADITAKMVEFSEKLDKIEQKESVVDFSEITNAIKELKVDNPAKIEAGEVVPKEPTKKTDGINFVGKDEGTQEISFSEAIAKIDNDVTLNATQKLNKKMEIWKAQFAKK